jgi:hypothetical protein
MDAFKDCFQIIKSNCLSDFVSGPSARIKKTVAVETNKVLLKESGVNLTLTIVDTPGKAFIKSILNWPNEMKIHLFYYILFYFGNITSRLSILAPIMFSHKLKKLFKETKKLKIQFS